MGLFTRAPGKGQEFSLLGIRGQVATERCIFTAAIRGVDLHISFFDDFTEIDQTKDFQSLSPFERIPTLRHSDFVVAGCRGIIAYIDSLCEGEPLAPRNAHLLGEQNYWIELSGAVLAPVIQGTAHTTNSSSTNNASVDQMDELLKQLSHKVTQGRFILGIPSLADPQLCAYIRLLRRQNKLPEHTDAIVGWYERVFNLIPPALRMKYYSYLAL